MKIVLDLRCLETASGSRGVGRYARELARSLRGSLPRGSTLHGLSWSGVGASLGLDADLLCRGPRKGIGLTDRFLLPPLLRRHRVDLYHATAYALPSAGANGVALVLTVHDLVADLYPGALSLRHRLAFRRTFRSARVADRVITVSETTRRDLLGRYPLDASKVVVVPNGVHRGSSRGEPSGFPDPFVLYVGGLDPLKNVPFLLEVLRRVHTEVPEAHLVIAGEEGARRETLARQAGRAGLAERVHTVGFLDDARLAAAYRDAGAFLFPSRYEGFGLPPLEAMAAGCPVVSSPGGALAEVLDDAALLRDPDDAEGWAGAVVSLLRDPAARGAAVDAGRRRSGTFTWEETARRTLAVYDAALGARGRA